MSDSPLATPNDLAEYLQVDSSEVDEATSTLLLASASEDIRQNTGQRFTPGDITVDLLWEEHLQLPSRWVTAVTSILDEDGDPLTGWRFVAGRLLWDRQPFLYGCHRENAITITYTAVVPDAVLADVKKACCELAAMAYSNPERTTAGEAIDDYRVTYAVGSDADAARISIIGNLRSKYGGGVATVGAV